jgi:hypothetical protein
LNTGEDAAAGTGSASVLSLSALDTEGVIAPATGHFLQIFWYFASIETGSYGALNNVKQAFY